MSADPEAAQRLEQKQLKLRFIEQKYEDKKKELTSNGETDNETIETLANRHADECIN